MKTQSKYIVAYLVLYIVLCIVSAFFIRFDTEIFIQAGYASAGSLDGYVIIYNIIVALYYFIALPIAAAIPIIVTKKYLQQ